MKYIEIADVYLNIDHVSFVRTEEHVQLGRVLAIHFAFQGASPLYLDERHRDELRRVLLDPETAPPT